jgi:hypothetical protein
MVVLEGGTVSYERGTPAGDQRMAHKWAVLVKTGYRGTSLLRNRCPVAPYSRTMPRLLWWY